MSPLQTIHDALGEFAAGLHLEEEDLPTVFDTSLLEASALMEEAVAREFSFSLAKRAVALRLASKVLIEDPSPDTMALVLNEIATLVAELKREMCVRPAAAEWSLARQFADVSEHIGSPGPAENPRFAELPRLLEQSAWLQKRLSAQAASAGLDLSDTPAARGIRQTAAKRWLKRAGARSIGRFCGMLDEIQGAIEYRARQVWFLRRSASEEHSLPQMYIFAHADLFPDFHSPLSESALALEVAKLKGLCLGLQLPELALCFDAPEWIAQYALSFLLPPAPCEWPVRSSAHLGRLLEGRLSRWYFSAFDHRLEPLEMAATVLRIGRPLFYERVTAHALLEYSLLQGVSFTRHAASAWIEIERGLEEEFQRLFEGYLLRLLHYPRLRNPEGWCGYLEALDALHYGGEPGDEFPEFRQAFLARRGLQSIMEILYRTSESHSSVN